jgi:hypothetical protein
MNLRSVLIFFTWLTLCTTNAHSQHLFGNPSCADWAKNSNADKVTWLNAFLVPLNLTHVSRKKPKEDKFRNLPSLDSAVRYVDVFCSSHLDEYASVGAVQFLDVLTKE